ncbi:MAG: MFS transporter [Acidobacteria bacterium]|nr:MFS transporter [Acidobacteriota bacterium]
MRVSAGTLRWVVVGVFILSSALNYLDRAVFNALAPELQKEFALSAKDFGYLISAFSAVYAFSSPLMGLLIDRLGLVRGSVLVVGAWSLVGMGTGLATTFAALVVCRAALGLAEAGGIPASGKAMALYLAPADRALGAALSQVGLTIGSSAAPRLASFLAPLYGWRSVFFVGGALGFVWIPVWLWISRRVRPFAGEDLPPEPAAGQQPPAGSARIDGTKASGDPPQARSPGAGDIVRDVRFWSLIAANILAMTVYSLWTNWTTLFLVTRFGLTQDDANRTYAWIPPIFATAGGLFGGWLAGRMIRGGVEVRSARLRVAALGATLALITAAAPAVPSAALATAAMSAGLFAVTCLSVNYYTIPLDLFGAARAAFGVAGLTSAYGLMQTFVSPIIGDWSDRFGWSAVCSTVAVLPLISIAVLYLAFRGRA